MALFLTLISTAAAAVFCVALLLLVLWQDARRRSNQFFALTMFLFAAFASINFLAHINYLLHYSVETLLKTATTLYGLSTVALFVFEVYFARSPRPWRRLLQWSGAVLAIILSGLLWTGAVYEQIAQLPDGTITYLLSPIGKIGLVIVSGYPLVGILALYVTNNERSRALWPITLLLPIDTFAAALPIFQTIPLNVLMMLIIALATARLMMREHVFKPMIELNQQLIKANDELSRANELKSQFLATMSHELRTPLNSVIGYTELVTSGLYGPLTDKQHDRLDKVGRNGRRLLALINDVLDLSKIEAGHMKLSRERVIVYDSLNVVFDARRPEAVAKGLQLINACPPDLPPITADPIRFEQILNNLISNAIQFTTMGSVTLNAVPQRSDLVFSVTDTGIGIAPERRSTIFDTFLSADGESTFIGRQEGTGLGLALTRHLVQMHGGSIWFTSDGIAGKGSTFYVTLPIAASSDNAIKPRTGLLSDSPVHRRQPGGRRSAARLA